MEYVRQRMLQSPLRVGLFSFFISLIAVGIFAPGTSFAAWPDVRYGYFDGRYTRYTAGVDACPWGMASNLTNTRTCAGVYHSDTDFLMNNYVMPPPPVAVNGVNDQDATGYVIPTSVDTVNEFVDLLIARSGSADWRNKAGSAYIAHTMLGTPAASRTRSVTAAQWTDLRARLNYASINWTGFSAAANSSNAQLVPGNPGRADVYVNSSPQSGDSIIITGVDGSVYVLFRSCANPAGAVPSLPVAISPATIQTRTSVNGVTGGTVYLDPDETAEIYAWNTATNYDGMNHWTTTRVLREFNNSGTWTAIHQGSYTVNANGDRKIWGPAAGVPYDIGLGVTEVGSLLVAPPAIPDSTTQVCYRTDITAAGGANIAAPDPSAESCIRFRSGETYPTTSVESGYIEPGETSDIDGVLKTPTYGVWGASGGYDVECSYTVDIIPGTGSGTNDGTLVGASPSGNCDHTITNTDDISVVAGTYSTDANTRIGTQVCVEVVLVPSPYVSGSTTSRACTTVVAKPVFQVIGGDVAAGAAIAGWPGNPFTGAGTTLGAFSNGAITGFATAKVMAGGPPRTLTFANTDPASVTSDLYGGLYNGTLSPADHWGAMPSNVNTAVGLAGTVLTGGASGVWKIDPGPMLTPSSSRTIPDYAQKVIYIQGDFTIRANLLYDERNNWTEPDQIPGVKFVVDGDIYIENDVTELNGIYIATGDIYTCADNSNNRILTSSPGSYYDLCDEPLRVNGIFSASKIYLDRTGGTARDGNNPTNFAERFYYLPELWQAQWPKDNATSGIKYDSITSLPPIL